METTKNFEAATSLTDIYGQAAAARPVLNVNQDLKLVSAWRQHAGQYIKFEAAAMPLAGKPERILEARPPVKVNYWLNSFDWRSIEIDRLLASTKEAAAARQQLQDQRRRQDLKAVNALRLEVKAAWNGKTLKEAAALRPAAKDQEAANRRLLSQTEKRFIRSINRRQDRLDRLANRQEAAIVEAWRQDAGITKEVLTGLARFIDFSRQANRFAGRIELLRQDLLKFAGLDWRQLKRFASRPAAVEAWRRQDRLEKEVIELKEVFFDWRQANKRQGQGGKTANCGLNRFASNLEAFNRMEAAIDRTKQTAALNRLKAAVKTGNKKDLEAARKDLEAARGKAIVEAVKATKEVKAARGGGKTLTLQYQEAWLNKPPVIGQDLARPAAIEPIISLKRQVLPVETLSSLKFYDADDNKFISRQEVCGKTSKDRIIIKTLTASYLLPCGGGQYQLVEVFQYSGQYCCRYYQKQTGQEAATIDLIPAAMFYGIATPWTPPVKRSKPKPVKARPARQLKK